MNTHTLNAELAEQMVWTKLWQAVDAETQARLGIRTKQLHDADCIMTTEVKEWFFNRVIGLGVRKQVTESVIDDLISLYHGYDAPIAISLCPDIGSTNTSRWLEDRGFSIANHWIKLMRENEPPASIDCDLRIELANENQGDLVGDIIVKGFGLDDIFKPVFAAMVRIKTNRVYIAWDDDQPAAVGTLSLYHDTAHLNTAATLSDYRGRGAQGAIVARRIEDGLTLGCKTFISETWLPGDEPNHSYNNMIRHGFKPAYERPNWVLPCK